MVEDDGIIEDEDIHHELLQVCLMRTFWRRIIARAKKKKTNLIKRQDLERRDSSPQ